MQAGCDITTGTVSSTSRSATASYQDGRHWANSATTTEQITGAMIAAGSDLSMQAGKLVNTVPESLREAAGFGTSLLLGGPVAAVSGYFIGKAVEEGIKHSETAQNGLNRLGLLGVSSLSSATLERNTDQAWESKDYSEGANLLTAAATLLNVGSIKKVVGKIGGAAPQAERVAVNEAGAASRPIESLAAKADSEAGGVPSFMQEWRNADGSWRYPPNDGFATAPVKTKLDVGTRLDRYGKPGGKYLAPEGTPFSARAIPPSNVAEGYYVYEVVKELPVEAGPVAPWFGQPGGGVQYKLQNSVQQLIDLGYIKCVKGKGC